MTKPKLSIVLSTFNRLNPLKEAIASIFEQSYSNYEIIIIDDASTDGTAQFLDHWEKPPMVMIIRNEKNHGLQRSLNKGVALASGEFIARIDDDDKWINKDKLKQQIDFLEKNPPTGLIGTSYIVGETVHNNPFSDEDIRKQILMRCPFRHSTVVFRKELWEKAGRYDESLAYSEDWDLWLKIGTLSKMANLPLVSTRINEGENLTSKFFLKQIPVNISIIKRFKSDYKGFSKALMYHRFVALFFRIIPLNSPVHKIFQKIFLARFALTRKS